jgi:hypothetical protein
VETEAQRSFMLNLAYAARKRHWEDKQKLKMTEMANED